MVIIENYRREKIMSFKDRVIELYLEGYRTDEIAKILGVSEAKVVNVLEHAGYVG